MKSKRPVNLDLTTIRLPLAAYTSIIHRITGVILFVGIGFMLYALDLSLASEQGFDAFKQGMTHPLVKLIAWGLLSGLLYHFLAGIKHLLLDMDIADGKESGRTAAKITAVLSVVLIILAGVWIW